MESSGGTWIGFWFQLLLHKPSNLSSEALKLSQDPPCNGSWRNAPALHRISTHHQDVVREMAGHHSIKKIV